MGKLKTYQTAGIARTGMGQLSEQPFRETELANERVSTFLAQAQQTFTEKANVYAEEQAVKDAITSPITKEQIDQARQTGGNPISEFLKGGTTYNKAAQQILGQQVAGELRLELDQISADVLEQVRTGEIQNQAQALEKLQEPISAHVEFLASLDPKIAEGYGAQATASVRNYFSQADTIIRNKEEEKRQINAKTMLNNIVRDVGNFMRANPNATTNEIDEYIDVVKQMARDTSFSLTRTQEKLSIQLDEEITKTRDLYVAETLAEKYPGRSVGEVIDALGSDQSSLAAHYKNMSLEDKDAFVSLLNRQITLQDSKTVAIRQEVSDKLKTAALFVDQGQIVPDSINNFIETYGNTQQREKFAVLKKVEQQTDSWNNTPITTLESKFTELDLKVSNRNIIKTPEEMETHQRLGNYLSNTAKMLQADITGTILSKHGVYEQIDYANENIAKEQIERRKLNIKDKGQLYGFSATGEGIPLLTVNEAKALVSQYTQGDGETRVGILRSIDNLFGDMNSAVMSQLSAHGLPMSARLSSFINDPLVTEKFLSFDNPDEKKRITDMLQSTTAHKMIDINKAIYNQLDEFKDVVMMGNGFNNEKAVETISSLVENLSYYAANEIITQGSSKRSATNNASALILSNYDIQETYYIPKKDGNTLIDVDGVVDKANLIKNMYLKKFNPVPFTSERNGKNERLTKQEMYEQLDEFGEWRTTADGTGLVFGLVLSTNEFRPIENPNGETLSFKFTDTTNILPTTDTQMMEFKTGYRLGFGLRSKVQMDKDKQRRELEGR